MEILCGFKDEIDVQEMMGRLRIESEDDIREFKKMCDFARGIAVPKAIYIEAYIESRGEDFVVINGVRFTSRVLKRNLNGIDRVFPYIATCGAELDMEKFSDDLLKQYWWDTIKACYLNIARKNLMEYIKKRYMLGKTSVMVPGGSEYGLWPIEQQKQLFSLFGDVESLIGVRLTDTYLMIPNKSISGILFPDEKDYNGCRVCRRQNCPGRRAKFDENLWKALGLEANLHLKK